MLTSYSSKLLNDYHNKRFTYRGKISIAISATATSINLFTIPNGYSFYMAPWMYDGDSTGKCVLMNNLTTAGAFSVGFTNSGEYNSITSGVPTLVSTYTNGTAANNPRSFDMTAQNQFRIAQAQNTNFSIRYTNTSTAFTLAILINGFLVPV